MLTSSYSKAVTLQDLPLFRQRQYAATRNADTCKVPGHWPWRFMPSAELCRAKCIARIASVSVQH